VLKLLDTPNVHVLLSLREIPEEVRHFLNARAVEWIDIAKKEQPRLANDLGEEVCNFLKRYGVRTVRWPRTPSWERSAEALSA
jgi:hypothetical protein